VAVGGFEPRSEVAVGTTCCAPSDILAGRFLEAEEEGAAMLEEAFAVATGLKPGDPLEIAGATLRIVGVVNPGIRPGKADVYMHLADAKRLIHRRFGGEVVAQEANMILVEVASSKVQREAIRGVKALLPGLVVSSYACYQPAAQVMGMNEAAIWAITAVLVFFAVALALKSQLASVIERRREIAILKVLGWSDGSIVRQVVAESGLLAIAGGVLGLAAGSALLWLLPAGLLVGATASAGRIVPEASTIGAALLLAFVGGATAGALPALLAARAEPAQALRRVG
jgi:ABC-type lipoprotein release transport system permease subunit